MHLLILGALGPYPDRIQLLVDEGHQLSYAHTEPLSSETPAQVRSLAVMAGQFAFEEQVERVLSHIVQERVDAVYSLLNVWDGSNRITAGLLRRGCPVPVIRHYKEHYLSPSDDERTCIEQSAGAIFINEESRAYFNATYQLPERTMCLDADMIPAYYLQGVPQEPLSSLDGCPHVLIAGSASADGGRYDYRELIREFVGAGAHVHLYGQFRALQRSGQLNNAPDVATSYMALFGGGRFHIHAPIPPHRFVEEWSQYDAGLMHVSRHDDPFRYLNMPNRYSAYLAAGVPIGLIDGQFPAVERWLEPAGVTIVARNVAHLVASLPDPGCRARAWSARTSFTFDATARPLLQFIESCLPAH
jgi:hypothetical protein